MCSEWNLQAADDIHGQVPAESSLGSVPKPKSFILTADTFLKMLYMF